MSKAIIIISAGKKVSEKIDIVELAKEAGKTLGGGGGGYSTFAQAGGTLVDKLPEAVENAKAKIRKQLEVGE